MATAIKSSTASLQRLQALNQSSDDFDVQIRQATQILGLPDGWDEFQEEVPISTVQRLGRQARGDWGLRWVLDKLKETDDCGVYARANPKVWRLLYLLIKIVPGHRCVSHLRSSSLLTILEHTLEECNSAPPTIPSAPPSESSETMQEEPQSSRKRKRGSGTSTPSKRVARKEYGLAQLFDALVAVIILVRDMTISQGHDSELANADQMRAVLTTESAQAARILRCWLNVLHRLITADKSRSFGHLHLSPVLDLWELRIVDAKNDSGASMEQFSTECFIPVLSLLQALQQQLSFCGELQDSSLLRSSILSLDGLLKNHIVSPSRAAFFDDQAAKTTTLETRSQTKKADLFASSLEPLRAKLLQAAQIEDGREPAPAQFSHFYAAVPRLLEVVIASSPAHTPKSRIKEKTWIQAAFVALVETAGCSLEVSSFRTPTASIRALEQCLQVLASCRASINSAILRDLFWFHAGFKYPLTQDKVIQWPLVIALVKLDPDIFLIDPRINKDPEDMPTDLAGFLFDQITATMFGRSSTGNEKRASDKYSEKHSSAPKTWSDQSEEDDIVQNIVVPIMSAFARNRDLLGFLTKWDQQVSKSARIARHETNTQSTSLWQSRAIFASLSRLLEQSLMPAQISSLFEEHAKRLDVLAQKKGEAGRSISGSLVIIQALLESIQSDEVVAEVAVHLQSLWTSYTLLVQSKHSKSSTTLQVAWITLSQLLLLLWPIQFHESSSRQEELLYPLLERATKDAASSHKNEEHRRTDTKSRAAALVFSLTTCDCLRTVPDNENIIQKRLQKSLKALSSKQLEDRDLVEVARIFCTEYTHLLVPFAADTCNASLSVLLSTLSEFDREVRDELAKALSQSVFQGNSASLQTAFVTALLEAAGHDNKHLNTLALNCFSQTTPTSVPRESRETILNSLVTILESKPSHAAVLLSIMVHLMESPNATANLSSDGAALFNIAQRLHESKVESPPVLWSLQELTRLTLGHIIPNKDQAQNKSFLAKYTVNIDSSKDANQLYLAKLAVLRGTFLAAYKENTIIRADDYTQRLSVCLENGHMPKDYLLEALNEIPLEALSGSTGLPSNVQAFLHDWIQLYHPLVDATSKGPESIPMNSLPIVFNTIAKYGQFPNMKWLQDLSSQLLHNPLTVKGKLTILRSFKEASMPLDLSEKLALISNCRRPTNDEKADIAYQLLRALISTLKDTVETDIELKSQQLALLPKLCSLLENCLSIATFNTLLDCIDMIIRDKPSLTTQHSIECVLEALLKLTSRSSPRLPTDYAPSIFARLSETSRLILLLHRGRFGGRFHLLVPLLQSLLLCLFVPNPSRGAALPPWLVSTPTSVSVRLTPTNAAQYTRLVSTLCSPTQSSAQRFQYTRDQASKSKKELNDPIKAVRERASQYVYPLLSSFSRYQLNGRLDPQVREKLMPGMWELLSLASLDRDSIDAMFAGLNRSEKQVWAGLWGEWEKANGRRVSNWEAK